MTDTVIRSSRVVTCEGVREAVILVKGGKIAAVTNSIPEGDFQVTDAGNAVVMAGITDPHVHINEPGRTDWEGFDTATKAAVSGGVTSLVEMPLNASPVTTTVGALEKKLAAAKGKLHCHCGFWGGVIPGNEKEIAPLSEKGVRGFKAFLTHSGIDEFPNVTEEDLHKAMPVIAATGLPLLVHCELPSPVLNDATADNRSYKNYLVSRPAKWEDDAIGLMIQLCEKYNCRTHIVHLSSAGSIEQIKRAKDKGLPVTVETAQHYLYFSSEQIPDGNTAYKCAPPIREQHNNLRLFEALQSGIIDFVATDHSPAPPEMKETGSGDLMKAWGGIASIQFSIPALWTAVKKHGVDISAIAKWLCEKPALLPSLSFKGKIEPGYDADLVIWSPEESFTVTQEMIHHRHKLTPYLDEQLYGAVKQTWLGGEKIYDDGKFLHLNKGQIL